MLNTVARTKLLNFAENVKESRAMVRRVNAAEGVWDAFGTIMVVAANISDAIDLRDLMCFPITAVPLSLAHNDDTPLKTNKATPTKAFEIRHSVVLTDATPPPPPIAATLIDGGILLHKTCSIASPHMQ